MAEKKYYWLKLKKDFFKRHDIQIIEAEENGKDYILFYLKMLVESVDHNGALRFNNTIPYNEKMLSTITNTNIDIVRSAMKMFTDLKMIEVLDDSTIYMAEVEKMMGTETYWAEHKRQQRIGQSQDNVQLMSNVSKQELDIDIEIDKDKDIESKKKKPTKTMPPTIEEVSAYTNTRAMQIDAERFIDYYQARNWMLGKVKMKDWKAAVRTWEKNEQERVQHNKPVSSNPFKDILLKEMENEHQRNRVADGDYQNSISGILPEPE